MDLDPTCVVTLMRSFCIEFALCVEFDFRRRRIDMGHIFQTQLEMMTIINMMMMMMKKKKKKKKKTSFSRYFQKVCKLHLCPENSVGASLCSKSSLYLFTLIMIMMIIILMIIMLMMKITCSW